MGCHFYLFAHSPLPECPAPTATARSQNHADCCCHAALSAAQSSASVRLRARAAAGAAIQPQIRVVPARRLLPRLRLPTCLDAYQNLNTTQVEYSAAKSLFRRSIGLKLPQSESARHPHQTGAWRLSALSLLCLGLQVQGLKLTGQRTQPANLSGQNPGRLTAKTPDRRRPKIAPGPGP